MTRWLFLSCLGLLGCDDPLLEAQHIEHTRVLGARVEAGGDPTRAWPRPGDAVHMQWLVADPRPIPLLGWAFSVCGGAEKARGIPECDGAPFAEVSSSGLDSALPALDFSVPDVGSKELVVQGSICSDEEPNPSCQGDGASVVFEIPLELESPGNRNPSIADEAILLDGTVWPAAEAEWLGIDTCSSADATPSLPIVSANAAKHSIAITLSDDDRDPGEELWLSQFSTRGDLDRVVSVIPAGDPLSVKSTWQAPGAIQDGRVVRFWFVLRDLRGGVDWAIRTLCATP